jgi:hypothetical protein
MKTPAPLILTLKMVAVHTSEAHATVPALQGAKTQEQWQHEQRTAVIAKNQ